MIKVLHLATSFGRGGAEVNLARLAANMDASRFSNTIVAMRRCCDGPMVQRVTQAGVRFTCLEMRAGVPDPIGFTRLLQIVREVRPQILQTWLYHADLLGLLVGKLARVPVILWNVQNTLINNKWMSRLVLRALVPLSALPTAVISNSQAGVRVHQELGYKPKKWVWIFNLLDLAEFRPEPEAREWLRRELHLGSDAFLIGLVARYDPMKDHANFIRAAALSASDNPKLNFVLVGETLDSKNQQLMSMLRAAGVQNRFHLLGLRDDVGRITAGFDIACSSSAYGEGTSNSVAEAMACAVPCVVTDVGDSALLVGNTGKVVSPRDPKSFANACRELIALSPQDRLRLGMAARNRVEESFSPRSIIAQYQELYEGLAATSIRNSCH
jgi:glycosyltransferase involved in cell wall biosynthesis